MEAIDALTKLTIITPSQSTNSTYNTSDGEDIGDFTISEDDQNTPTTIIEFVNRTAKEVPFYLKFRNEPWVIPLVALALFNVAAILIFEIYVLYKSCGGRRHLFLGQVLLLGLFLSSVLGLLYVPEPHWLFCGITRAGIGIVYSIVFGTLFGEVHFSAENPQWCLLQCLFPGSSVVFHHCSGVASIRARSLRENNKEALYIGVSIAIALIFWVAWISVAIIFDRRYEAPAEGFGLLCTSLVIFFLIFIPKAVHLSSPRSKLGNGSSGGSHSVIHTPSFLHLQPHAVLPSSTQGTLIKQNQVNADYCRGFSSRLWRYDYPSFHQMEPPPLSHTDTNSMKKSNGSSFNHSHLY